MLASGGFGKASLRKGCLSQDVKDRQALTRCRDPRRRAAGGRKGQPHGPRDIERSRLCPEPSESTAGHQTRCTDGTMGGALTRAIKVAREWGAGVVGWTVGVGESHGYGET